MQLDLAQTGSTEFSLGVRSTGSSADYRSDLLNEKEGAGMAGLYRYNGTYQLDETDKCHIDCCFCISGEGDDGSAVLTEGKAGFRLYCR